jgi:hypothetical protein
MSSRGAALNASGANGPTCGPGRLTRPVPESGSGGERLDQEASFFRSELALEALAGARHLEVEAHHVPVDKLEPSLAAVSARLPRHAQVHRPE